MLPRPGHILVLSEPIQRSIHESGGYVELSVLLNRRNDRQVFRLYRIFQLWRLRVAVGMAGLRSGMVVRFCDRFHG